MAQKTALLLQIPEPYCKGLIDSLRNDGYRLIVANEGRTEAALSADDTQLQMDARALQKWLEDNHLAIDCWITASNITLEMAQARPITYPPYHLYETILKGMHQCGYGRVVNLYEGPGSSRGLSMPQINTIASRYQALLHGADILFNSVNIEPVQGLTHEQEIHIQNQRLETIHWLATTSENTPHLQFFRGYEASP